MVSSHFHPTRDRGRGNRTNSVCKWAKPENLSTDVATTTTEQGMWPNCGQNAAGGGSNCHRGIQSILASTVHAIVLGQRQDASLAKSPNFNPQIHPKSPFSFPRSTSRSKSRRPAQECADFDKNMSTHLTHLSHPKYRPDIDGLRAVAILSVVAFHAFPGAFSGGFIGVDIFFVISGFLISTILFENLSNGTFSFAEFYSRRIRRLFPALFVVLATTYVTGWFTLLSDEYKQLGKHIAAGAVFISNFLLWSDSGYFDTSAETKPLLHLWSLGIEEQYYLIWPLLVYAAWKRKLALPTVILVVSLLSFLWNVRSVQHDVIAAFYSPGTRFWELMSGSFLASLQISNGRANVPTGLAFAVSLQPKPASGKSGAYLDIARQLASLLGFLLFAIGFSCIDTHAAFPGFWACLPVIGSGLIIFAGKDAWVNRHFLAHRALVSVGLISYPLYLWHWPILAFVRIAEGQAPSLAVRVLAVSASVILAVITYLFVEMKIRNGRYERAKAIGLIALVSFIAVIGYKTYRKDGYTDRLVNALNTTLTTGWDGGDHGYSVSECGIKDEATKKLFLACAMDKRQNVRYALLGDSKAQSLYPGLIRTSDSTGRWLFIGGNGPKGPFVPLLSDTLKGAEQLTSRAIEAVIANPNINKVVLVTAARILFGISDRIDDGNQANYDYRYLTQLAKTNNYREVFARLARAIDMLAAGGKEVVLVVDNPGLPEPQDCVSRKTAIGFLNRILPAYNKDCYISLAEYQSQTLVYRKLLTEISEKSRGVVQIFDPTDVYCDMQTGVCGPIRNGRILYSYTDHISDYAAGLVGRKLNKFLGME
jgi:peptidoglycan/LPS O-acetylase OafA/YrhL